MSYIEQLIEALVDATNSGTEVWESIGSADETIFIINEALKEQPDDFELSSVIEHLDEDNIFEDSPYATYKKCLIKLRKKVKRIRNAYETDNKEI